MKKGHRLDAIDDFPSDLAADLAKFSIATAEEFLAQAEVGGPEFESALDVTPLQFQRAVSVAKQTAGPAYENSLDQIRNAPDYPLGARPATSDEFDQFLPGQEAGETT